MLKDLNSWRLHLGLLPVPLVRDSDQGRFILLNGTSGNFCLDIVGSTEAEKSRNISWSANVAHYVTALEDRVVVRRWDREQDKDFLITSSAPSLEKFHHFLEQDQPTNHVNVVTHVMRTYRKLRALLGPEVSGPHTLSALLVLLACAHDDVSPGALNLAKWRLQNQAQELAAQLRSDQWDSLREELLTGRRLESLTTEISLVLRHASGQVFQEAHYEALFVPQLELALPGILPRGVRTVSPGRGLGLHFTPPSLARTVVEEALRYIQRDGTISIFDPACGSGEFLREAYRQLRLQGYRGVIQIHGWDISSAACELARFVMAWESRGDAGTQISIEEKDSLAEPAWPHVDLILMNPPFVSWRDMSTSQKTVLREVLGSFWKGRPDLSAGFVLRAAASLNRLGVLGTIVPASFLDSETSEPLRKHLSGRLFPNFVARLGSHSLFASATVDAGIFVGSSQEGFVPPIAMWADHRPESTAFGLRQLRRLRSLQQDGVEVDSLVSGKGFSIYDAPDLRENTASWAPRPLSAIQMMDELERHRRTTDFFNIRQGALTGLNKAFVLPFLDFSRLPKSEKGFFRPAAMNSSIRDGMYARDHFVFYPYGQHEITSEQALKRELPTYFKKWLEPHKSALCNRSEIDPDRWWLLTRERHWQTLPQPKIISKYFGGVGSFAWDGEGDSVVVQGYAWMLRQAPVGLKSELVCLAYLTILNSNFFYELLSALSNNVAGGQLNLSKRYVGQAPLPNLLDTNSELVTDLALEGERLAKEGVVDFRKAEQLVRAAYGTSPARNST
jgi:adenine-specific DNA-methyltransferase